MTDTFQSTSSKPPIVCVHRRYLHLASLPPQPNWNRLQQSTQFQPIIVIRKLQQLSKQANCQATLLIAQHWQGNASSSAKFSQICMIQCRPPKNQTLMTNQSLFQQYIALTQKVCLSFCRPYRNHWDLEQLQKSAPVSGNPVRYGTWPLELI